MNLSSIEAVGYKDWKQLIAACPKAELHCHIDCLTPELYLKFAERNGIKTPFKTIEEVETFSRFNSLDEFLTVMLTFVNVIQTEDDFIDMIVACAKDMYEQHIIYREVMFDYTVCYGSRGIPLDIVMNGFAKGLELAKKNYGSADIRFIANLDRRATAEKNCAYLEKLFKYKNMIPLIAIGMDMDEKGYPAHNQADAFAFAKANGMYLTGHSGEDLGPESIWDALNALKLDRVDHGVRAVEDEKLMKHLSKNNILLTLCPDSNISLGVYNSWKEYPLRKLIDNGVKVSINSDDPGILPYNLSDNLIKCIEIFNLTLGETVALIRNPFIYNFTGKEYLFKVDAWLSDVGIAIN